MHYYQHHIKDFNNATRHLTRVERCLYRESIELYYDSELPLPKCIDVLSRRLNVQNESESDALNYVLSEFFVLEDDGYHQDRCDYEIDKYHANNSAKARAGKASAAARRAKKLSENNQNSTDVQHVLNTCSNVLEHNSTNQEPLTNNHKPIINNGSPSAPVIQKSKSFQKPTQAEISAHMLTKGSLDDSERFFNFYESNGWRVGKNPMKNWKACINNWLANHQEKQQAQMPPKIKIQPLGEFH